MSFEVHTFQTVRIQDSFPLPEWGQSLDSSFSPNVCNDGQNLTQGNVSLIKSVFIENTNSDIEAFLTSHAECASDLAKVELQRINKQHA